MYNPYGNMYQTPYNASYGGFMPSQGNYTGQAPFAPQNGNYAPTAQPQQQPPQMNTNKIYVTGIEDARARQLPPNSDFIFLDNDKPLLYRKTEMGRIKRTIDGLLKKEKKGGEENG